MTETLSVIIGLAVGMALGIGYLLSVWHTARGMPRARHPVLFAFATLSARFALVLAGFYALTAYGWQALLAALTGFVMVRMLVVRRLADALPGSKRSSS